MHRPVSARLLPIVVLLFVSLSAACSNGAHTGGDGTAFRSVGPPGVEISPPAEYRVRGLYLSQSAADAVSCCWLAPKAQIVLAKKMPAKRIIITVYLPENSVFVANPQQVTIRFPNGQMQTRSGLQPGMRTASFDVPPKYQTFTGDLPVSLTMKVFFVPAKLHINADTRQLSMVLRSVAFL
jgi:hypothetical protein